jgi:hypothetical protein
MTTPALAIPKKEKPKIVINSKELTVIESVVKQVAGTESVVYLSPGMVAVESVMPMKNITTFTLSGGSVQTSNTFAISMSLTSFKDTVMSIAKKGSVTIEVEQYLLKCVSERKVVESTDFKEDVASSLDPFENTKTTIAFKKDFIRVIKAHLLNTAGKKNNVAVSAMNGLFCFANEAASTNRFVVLKSDTTYPHNVFINEKLCAIMSKLQTSKQEAILVMGDKISFVPCDTHTIYFPNDTLAGNAGTITSIQSLLKALTANSSFPYEMEIGSKELGECIDGDILKAFKAPSFNMICDSDKVEFVLSSEGKARMSAECPAMTSTFVKEEFRLPSDEFKKVLELASLYSSIKILYDGTKFIKFETQKDTFILGVTK